MVRLEARLAVGNLLSLCLSASPLGWEGLSRLRSRWQELVLVWVGSCCFETYYSVMKIHFVFYFIRAVNAPGVRQGAMWWDRQMGMRCPCPAELQGGWRRRGRALGLPQIAPVLAGPATSFMLLLQVHRQRPKLAVMWDSQPSPTLRSLGWPGAVCEKYLEPTPKLLVLKPWRASSSEELPPKDAGRKGFLSLSPVPLSHVPRL